MKRLVFGVGHYLERNHVPTLEEMGIEEDTPGHKGRYVWQGGIVCRLRCLGGRKGCLLATTDLLTEDIGRIIMHSRNAEHANDPNLKIIILILGVGA